MSREPFEVLFDCLGQTSFQVWPFVYQPVGVVSVWVEGVLCSGSISLDDVRARDAVGLGGAGAGAWYPWPMSAAPQHRSTPEEYLAFEREAEEKHEYWDGEIVAMAGASPEHNAICFNLAGALKPQLRGSGWRGFTSDQRVRVPLSHRYVYPDLTVVCGQPVFEDDDAYTLVNPTLVVEVLSPTTENKDRGPKLFGYRTLPSLRGYLLGTWVEHWSRQDDGRWLVTELDEVTAILDLPEVGCKLPLAEVYEDVELSS